MSSVKLRNCPFCGGPAEFINPRLIKNRVRCKNPGNLPWCIGAEVSATPEAWNTRVPASTLSVLREALERLLAGMPSFQDEPLGPEDSVGVIPNRIKITVGDIRAARAALEQK